MHGKKFKLQSRTRLCSVVLVTAITWFVAKATITGEVPGLPGWGILGCKPCAIDDCANETNCRGGTTMDVCNCCLRCLRVEGESCGGIFYRLGRCDRSLYCNITGPYTRDPVGKCALLYQSDSTPAPRQNIPSVNIPSVNIPSVNIPSVNIPSVKSPKILQLPITLRNPTAVPMSAVNSTASINDHNGGFFAGLRKNTGLKKDKISNKRKHIDTTPAILFMLFSGILLAVILVVVTFLDRTASKAKTLFNNPA